MQQLLGSQGQVCKQGNAKGKNKPEAYNLASMGLSYREREPLKLN